MQEQRGGPDGALPTLRDFKVVDMFTQVSLLFTPECEFEVKVPMFKKQTEQLSKPSNNHWSVPSRPPPSSPKFFESKTKKTLDFLRKPDIIWARCKQHTFERGSGCKKFNASTLERNDASQKRPQFGNQVMLLFAALVFVFLCCFFVLHNSSRNTCIRKVASGVNCTHLQEPRNWPSSSRCVARPVPWLR